MKNRAFTQLTADRQFAHLGLMMLGVLAQVDKAVAPFAPGPSAVEEGFTGQDIGTVEAAPLMNQAVGDVLGGDELGTTVSREQLEMEWEVLRQGPDVDMGEVVSREEVEGMVDSVEVDESDESATSEPISQAPRDNPDEKPAQPASKNIEKVNTKKRKALPLLSSSTGTTSGEPETKPLAPKKKPAASGSDEFDSIFGSLEMKEKKKKEKPVLKAGGGDEFDNIFGGLEKKKAKPVTKPGTGDEFDDIFGKLEKKKKKKPESSSKVGGLDKDKIKKKKKKDEFDDIFEGLL